MGRESPEFPREWGRQRESERKVETAGLGAHIRKDAWEHREGEHEM